MLGTSLGAALERLERLYRLQNMCDSILIDREIKCKIDAAIYRERKFIEANLDYWLNNNKETTK